MPETNSTVEYRIIDGFPGYRVGNDGSVWSRLQNKGANPELNEEADSKPVRKNFIGENNPSKKLTEQKVKDIRSEYLSGNITQLQLAIKYGVKEATISLILRRKTWTHI